MIYEYQCQDCGDIHSKVRRLEKRHEPTVCPECGGEGRLGIFSAPMAHVQPEAHYVCPATGEQVTSWRQRKNLFAKHDLIDANDFDQEYAKKQRLKKKEERDKLAKDYLPKDLHNKLREIGTKGVNDKSLKEKGLDRFAC